MSEDKLAQLRSLILAGKLGNTRQNSDPPPREAERRGTHLRLDFQERHVQPAVHIFDCGVVSRAAFQHHLRPHRPPLVGEDVSVGDDPAVLGHHEARAARHRDVLTGERHAVTDTGGIRLDEDGCFCFF